ncbi:MAG: ROK family protein [Vicinamibacterales bacterium]
MRIGIDLGGTKIAGVALDLAGGELASIRTATPRGDYEATILAVRDLVQALERRASRSGTVGIGMPGTMSGATGLVKNANSTWLIGRPFQADVERALGRPVRLANDANCFALSEATDGAASRARVAFGVILGTGTGGGVVVDRRVWEGPNGIAGEWGHNPLPWPEPDEWPGEACYCGRTGCVETFLSGPGMAGDHLRRTGESLTARAIHERARAGDRDARDTLNRYAARLAKALAVVINILDPDVIVLGGGLSEVDEWYDAVPRLWGRFVFSDTVRTELVRAQYGAASGVRGAAWLWNAE